MLLTTYHAGKASFVPNEKQVKAANKLLKTIPHNGVGKKVDGYSNSNYKWN
ncbi:hypothetical protein L195_g013350 [Trifolium pratense]|uniref:Uncharacterized protein n=1 Tax=Trifolium pratense TaxID=57577 RepID=A0A2K3PMW1_TRIPR|nr:hypothetical protein L195_g013350 [Trifolium pratense]